MMILSALFATALVLQNGEVNPAAPPAAPPEAVPDALEISLADAIQAAFTNNLALRGALLEADAFYEGFGASWGEFDTRVFFNGEYSEVVTAPNPSTVFFQGVPLGTSAVEERDSFDLRTGLRGMFQTGTTWDFGIGPRGTKTQSQTLDSSSGSFTDISSKTRTASWGLSLTHPLLRDGANDYAMSSVKLAAQDARIAAINASSIADSTMTTVITTYWNLVFALQDVATRELSVDLAQELLDITRRKFQQGLQNRLDVIETEAEVANRSEELLTARNELQQAMDDLRRAAFAPEDPELWNTEIAPRTGYDILEESDVDLEDAIQQALRRRPDILEAQLQVERADIEVERAENQTLPQLDVTGGYGLNSNETNAWRAVNQLNEEQYHEYRVSLDFEISLGNRRAEHDARRRRLDRERAGVRLREVEILSISEVRREVRNVRLQTERVFATAETVRLRREVYEGERRRLENDLSTPFEVREDQRDLLTAIDNETRARLDLAVARTLLLAAQGRLLSILGYEIEPPDVSLESAPPAP